MENLDITVLNQEKVIDEADDDIDIRKIVNHKLDKKDTDEKVSHEPKDDDIKGKEGKEIENCKYFLKNQIRTHI